jgi:hypothetical protein
MTPAGVGVGVGAEVGEGVDVAEGVGRGFEDVSGLLVYTFSSP